MSAPRRSLRIVDNAVKVAKTANKAKTVNVANKAKTANVANKAKTANVAKKAKTANVADTAKLNIVTEDGYDLSTELSKKTIALIANNIEDEEKYKITDEDWVEFFCDFFDYIQNNIDLCLSKIHGLNHLKIQDLYKVNFSAGGFDDDFNNDLKHNYNIGLYEELFKQFKEGTNKINKCHRINQLLSYIGAAVLQIADNYKRTSKNELVEFYRKIALILELAVYPEIFLHYMTGDSTGKTHSIDGKFKGHAKYNKYMGIWLRKKEYLGIITHNKKDYWKNFDSGLRLFVRNYIRRLITYMRTYNVSYPLGYELPYNYSGHPNKLIKTPLPYNGVYLYSTTIYYYYINFDDWDHIPNILLPRIARQTSLNKNYISPNKWKNPPPDWWIERTLKLLEGFKWWDIKKSDVEKISNNLIGTKQLAKWIKLNGIIPQQYESYSEMWEADNEDEYRGGGNSVFSKNKKHFKIISDKDIALDPIIRNELKLKLEEYFKLNIVKSNDKNKERYLRDGTYIDNLNTSILYSMDKHLPHDKILKNNAIIKKLNATF
jgi:hypothetical protein